MKKYLLSFALLMAIPTQSFSRDIVLSGVLSQSNGGTGSSAAFTTGSLLYQSASGAFTQDNANLFWDGSLHRLGIGTATPASALDVKGALLLTTPLAVSSGGTGQATDSEMAYKSTYWYGVPQSRNIVGSLVATQDRLFACPVYVRINNTVITDIGFRVTTAGVASTAAMGFYDATGTGGRPGALLASTGTAATTNLNTDVGYTLSSPVTVAKGWYWLAVAHHWTTTAPTVVTFSSVNPYEGEVGGSTINTSIGGADGCVYVAITYPTMPNPFGTPTDVGVATGGPSINVFKVQ